MIDHSRNLDFLDPPVAEDGSKVRELTPRPSLEELDRIVEGLPRGLDADHAAMLGASGIAPAVIAARGYRTIIAKSILERLGFQAWQSRIPALLVPLRNRDGLVVAIQIRPDRPRLDKGGKAVKYDSVMGAAHRVDFPSGLPLPDPGGEIWVTEGVKKADALASRGIYCLALPGVDAWSGIDAIKDLKSVEWTGRTVVIAFDSDVVTNPQVSKAREALAGFLRDRKASIQYLNLPTGPDGQKQGIDDYLAAGHMLEDVRRLVVAPPTTATPDPVSTEWMRHLDRTPTGRLIANSRTLGLILRNDPAFAALRFDEFSHLVRLGDLPIENSDVFRWAEYIETSYGRGSTVPRPSLREAAEAIGRERSFHPIRDWLDSLQWDGISRLGELFSVYYGSRKDEYSRAVGRNFLIGAVARIYDPGCKHDSMPILEGRQGIRKSSSIRALFGAEYFAEMKATPDSKDFDAALQGMWVLEFAELESLDRASIARIKVQLSTQSDWVRLSYRKDPQSYPRQCVFIGTTNDTEYLRDPTGARRFWPIRVLNIDLEGITRDREQLWAEAVHLYRAGATWWEVPEDKAREEQEARYQTDSWEEVIRDWLRGKSEVTTTEVLEECLKIERGRHDRLAQMRTGNIFRRLGWERIRVRRGNGLIWVYRPPDSVPTSEVGTNRNKVGTPNDDAIVPTVPTKNGDSTFSTLPENSTEKGRNSGNNPVLEQCSHLVPTSGGSGRLGTDDTDVWEEIE